MSLTRALRATFAALILVVLIALALVPRAHAQHTGDMGTAPPPPAGDGRIRVGVVHAGAENTPNATGTNATPAPAGASELAELPIALYSLSSDGQPGYTSGVTDAMGQVVFENLSTDPGIVYLIGAHYREIPFGARARFAEGEKETLATVEVAEPTDRLEGIRVEELRLRLDWQGDRVLVRELVRLVNPGARVVLLADGADAGGADAGGAKGAARAILTRSIGASARDFELGSGSLGDGIRLEDGRVRYAGPLYPGDQQIEYQYVLPRPASGEPLRVPIELAQSVGRVVAIAGTSGIEIAGPGFIASSEVASDSGTPLAAWARGPLAAGAKSELRITLPAARSGDALVSIPRADLWLDLDDTRMTATAELTLEVAPGAPVAGTPDAPLLRITLPQGATLTGVAPEAEALGLVPRDHGGFDVVGPLAEGTTPLGYAYRLDAKPEGVALDLRFSKTVETLNVLVADTGLALESGRLHRLRPFRSGTRNYLHREAFNVAPDEVVDLHVAPLRDAGPPREAAIAFAFAAIAAATAFLAQPLTRRARRLEVPSDDGKSRLRAELESTYSAIRDLDHDLETGKLETADHATMRAELRARAIELLAAVREADGAAGSPDPASASGESHDPRAATRATTIATAPAVAASSAADSSPGFCPACGVAREASWRFCTGCGAALPSGAARGAERPA